MNNPLEQEAVYEKHILVGQFYFGIKYFGTDQWFAFIPNYPKYNAYGESEAEAIGSLILSLSTMVYPVSF
jgi:hypothetical protein